MKKPIFISLIFSAVFFSCTTSNNQENNPKEQEMNIEKIAPPVCKKIEYSHNEHGIERKDPYFWLKERDNPEVISYLEEENKYTSSKLSPISQLEEDIFNEIKGRIKEEDESVPFLKNGYFYRVKYKTGSEYPIYVRSLDSEFEQEEIILDGNKMAEGYDYFNIGGYSISPNNEIVAFATDTVSRRIYNVQFKNLKTGELYDEILPNNDGSIAWANDNKSIFYSVQDPESLRSYRVYKHILGTEPSEDILVFEESDDTFYSYVYRSKSGKFIMIQSTSTLTDEVNLLSADEPNGKFKPFAKRERGVEYSVSNIDDDFYILTNRDGATNFKLMKCSGSNTSPENWETVIDEREETLLEDFDIFESHLVLSETTKGLNQIRVINKNGSDFYVPFHDETYVAYPTTNPEFSTNKLRFYYSSLTTPGSTIEIDMDSQEQLLLKQQEVVGGYDVNNYQSERIWAEARDGIKVPISIVYKKGTPLDGSAPLLQYAYGSYGSSTNPYFSISRLSLLDRGFVFAIAHIRGGEELGRSWYEDGKLLKKWNTFNDFIDCSKHLIKEGYTSPENLYAMGGSAGGLLMGVVVNEAPELYNGVVAAVPFVDVMTTMLDASIPLTTGEYDEWGNPNEKEYFDYMLSYSPYDQVKEQAYPNILITTGLHDSQVQYWEPAKWIAKLRTHHTGENLLMMKTNMAAGHGGASGRFESIKEIATEYGFVIGLQNGSIQ